MEIGHAYPVAELSSARRQIKLQAQGPQTGTIWLEDTFRFTQASDVEEAFVTWCDVMVEGATATLSGAKCKMRLTIEAPAGAGFQVEALEEQSKANAMHGVLKRLSFSLPKAVENNARVRMEIN